MATYIGRIITCQKLSNLSIKISDFTYLFKIYICQIFPCIHSNRIDRHYSNGDHTRHFIRLIIKM